MKTIQVEKDIQSFKDIIAMTTFNMAASDAQDKKICIRCKASINTSDWEPTDIDEYLLSSLCPDCFDKITL